MMRPWKSTSPSTGLDDPNDIITVISDSPNSSGVYGLPKKRSFAFDVGPEGALETPPSFKGFTLGAWAHNNTARESTAPTPSAASSPTWGRRDEDPTNAPVCDTASDEQGTPLCCPLVGPILPLAAPLTMMHTGESTILSNRALMTVRTVQLIAALAASLATTVLGASSRDTSRIFPSLLATIIAVRGLFNAYKFRSHRDTRSTVITWRFISGLDGFLLQTSATVVLASCTAEMLAFVSPAFAYLTAGPAVYDAAFVLLLLLGVSIVLDPWATPVPFRLFFIVPAAIMNTLFVIVTVAISGSRIHLLGIAAVSGTLALLVGLFLHVYARAVYLWVHQSAMLGELKIPSAVDIV